MPAACEVGCSKVHFYEYMYACELDTSTNIAASA